MTSKMQPAIFGGLFLGILSALPIVSAANLCCCLWVVAGGVIAAYFLQQESPTPITAADGAQVGLLAGLFGAAVYLVVSLPLSLLLAPMQREMLERILEGTQDMPPEVRVAVENLAAGGGIVVSFFLMLIFGVVFATLGGMVGAVLFRRNVSPPGRTPAPYVPPPPGPPPPPPPPPAEGVQEPR